MTPPQRIGIVRESQPGETRVASTPATVGRLIELGYDVVVESGAGALAGITDDAYTAAGASVVAPDAAWGSDIVLKVNAPTTAEIARLADHATLVSLIAPGQNEHLVDELTQRDLTVLALDAVPRISRAQSMDVLSSMANIAGYRAMIEAAHHFDRFLTGQVTAAGKVPPAKVLVAGAGVAGLAAIGTASSLGAVVRATDPRPEVADQVKSIGGEYLAVDAEQEVSTDGYAKATTEDYDRKAADLYTAQAADVDIIITTALIPGRPAPRLLTEDDVAGMKPGSVIVDMAAAQGGNVAGSVAGEKVVTSNGVTILGYTDLAARMPTQASQLYGTNLVNLLTLLTPAKDGQPRPRPGRRRATWCGRRARGPQDLAATTRERLCQRRRLRRPRSPPSRSRARVAARRWHRWSAARRRRPDVLPGQRHAPDPLSRHFTVLMLSDRHRLLRHRQGRARTAHATDVGDQRDQRHHRRGRDAADAQRQPAVLTLSFIAVLLASINIVGGFAVTRRMLSMFSKG